MTTPQLATPVPAAPLGGHEHAPASGNYLTASKGFMSWAFTLDHKRIGIMYLTGILFSLLLGDIFALLVRTEHLTPDKTIVDSSTYNQFFTLHGAIMVFLVIIPGIPAALGNFILPIMLGAKDVAFPRLNLLSFYLWVTGAITFVIVLLTTGLDTGWTFYTPYSTDGTNTNMVMATFGAFVLGFSSIFTGLNFLVTIHRLRAPGMTWFRMPLLVWALYATGLMQVLATPVLGITLLLLIAEHTLHVGIFNPAYGGDPVLYQHFFWFYSHPAVYIMIVPGMGVQSEMLAVHSHREMFGYKAIAYSSIALALLGFIVWGHHLFTSGQSGVINLIFSALTFTVAVPSAVKVFNWLATLWRGAISFTTPMLYALSFIFIFGIGGLTGLWLGALAVDLHLHDTYFVVAHFHYVMAGTMIAFAGAIHHWWPKITGRMYNENLGRIACTLIFVGFNLTFIPQFIMGSMGMTRRYWKFDPAFADYHFWSTIGAYVGAAGATLTLMYLLASLVWGKKAPANPWGGASLEWQTSSPPPLENFSTPPVAGEPYDFSRVEWDPAQNGYKVNPPAGSFAAPVTPEGNLEPKKES